MERTWVLLFLFRTGLLLFYRWTLSEKCTINFRSISWKTIEAIYQWKHSIFFKGYRVVSPSGIVWARGKLAPITICLWTHNLAVSHRWWWRTMFQWLSLAFWLPRCEYTDVRYLLYLSFIWPGDGKPWPTKVCTVHLCTITTFTCSLHDSSSMFMSHIQLQCCWLLEKQRIYFTKKCFCSFHNVLCLCFACTWQNTFSSDSERHGRYAHLVQSQVTWRFGSQRPCLYPAEAPPVRWPPDYFGLGNQWSYYFEEAPRRTLSTEPYGKMRHAPL